MSNYKPSAGSKGIVAIATNTDTVDYVKLAHATLSMAAKRLGVNYKVITPTDTESSSSRLDIDSKTLIKWKNQGRWQAYNSPWEETILIDADYLVLTDRLNQLWGSQSDYMICGANDMLSGNNIPATGLAPVWATVVYFRRSARAQALFELVQRIERNYGYYRLLFNIHERHFRNDYAFAMADQIINGHSTNVKHRLPWTMTTVDLPVQSIDINTDWLVVRTDKSAHILPRQDLHIMSKQWFGSSNFDTFLEQCND